MSELWDLNALPECLHIKVTPKAKSERITKDQAEDGSAIYKVYLTVVPEDGKANKALIALLAKELKIAKSRIVITHGLTCREKTIKILPPL